MDVKRFMMFPSHNRAAGHPLTGWHGAGGVGIRPALKTAVFTLSRCGFAQNSYVAFAELLEQHAELQRRVNSLLLVAYENVYKA